MEQNKNLVKQGHELAVLLGTQHGMLDAASLVQRLTAQLDVTTVAMREMTQQRDALAAEVYDVKHPGTYLPSKCETPATDAYLREVRAQARKDGAHFVANRMLAAWDAGFIEDTAKNAADIARMILTSTEFMADAPEGDFDRSFADGVLADIAAELRKGGAA
ncbi:hypothetical protein [Franconibacter helveticus]|uniref:hypothetical protein n=1 Tax=Franconibacter helveticus TaxID=357240 RepID=UPI000DA23703|nr:hypothetical protein [Franconibacter helveticus]